MQQYGSTQVWMRLPSLCRHYISRYAHAGCKTLKVSPAMAAGVTDRLWDIADIVMLIEKAEAEKPTKRGPYKKIPN